MPTLYGPVYFGKAGTGLKETIVDNLVMGIGEDRYARSERWRIGVQRQECLIIQRQNCKDGNLEKEKTEESGFSFDFDVCRDGLVRRHVGVVSVVA